MKEIPILFSAPMVQAILEGRKTQTRRLMKPQIKYCDHSRYTEAEWKDKPTEWSEVALKIGRAYCSMCGNGVEYSKDYGGIKCPQGKPGDLLWVRETWGVGCRPDPFQGSVGGIEFKADSKFIDDIEPLPLHRYENFDYGNYDKSGWRPSIHMPKAIARIWLQVTDIRVERLHDISEEDAKTEGMEKMNDDPFPYKLYSCGTASCVDAKTSFRFLWEDINGDGSWVDNPWVWVISFKVLSTTGKPSLCP